MRSYALLLILSFFISLFGIGCDKDKQSTPHPSAFCITLSSLSGNTATGDWICKSYNPCERQITYNGFIQVQLQDKNGKFFYSNGFTERELEWLSSSRNRPDESDAIVHFTLNRPSGEWDFHGTQDACGCEITGKFVFKPDDNFVTEVESICGSRPTLEELIKLSLANAKIEGLRKYMSSVDSFDVDNWLKLINSGIAPDYASDMKSALGRLHVNALIECRNSGMTPEFASGIKEAGYSFNHKELIRLRNSGMTKDFAAKLKSGGIILDVDALIRLRNSGVPPDYALFIRESGLGESIDDIIKLRNSGVPGEFISEIQKSGYHFSVKDIIKLRNSGMPASYLRTAKELGYFSDAKHVNDIIKLRNSGVPASYLETVKEAGYSFTVDEIIMLRNRGVSTRYLTEIIQTGYKQLSAEKIANLYTRGVSVDTIREIRFD